MLAAEGKDYGYEQIIITSLPIISENGIVEVDCKASKGL